MLLRKIIYRAAYQLPVNSTTIIYLSSIHSIFSLPGACSTLGCRPWELLCLFGIRTLIPFLELLPLQRRKVPNNVTGYLCQVLIPLAKQIKDLQWFLPHINATRRRTPGEWRTSPYLFPFKCFWDTAVYHLAQLSKTFIREERRLLGGKPRCLFFAALQCLPFVRPVWFYSSPPLSKGVSQKWLSELATVISRGCAKGNVRRHAHTKRW